MQSLRSTSPNDPAAASAAATAASNAYNGLSSVRARIRRPLRHDDMSGSATAVALCALQACAPCPALRVLLLIFACSVCTHALLPGRLCLRLNQVKRQLQCATCCFGCTRTSWYRFLTFAHQRRWRRLKPGALPEKWVCHSSNGKRYVFARLCVFRLKPPCQGRGSLASHASRCCVPQPVLHATHSRSSCPPSRHQCHKDNGAHARQVMNAL